VAALELVLTGTGGPGPVPMWAALLVERRDRTNAVLARSRAVGARPEELLAAMRDLGPLVESLAARAGTADAGAAGHDLLLRAADALVDAVVGLVRTRRWSEQSVERNCVLEAAPELPEWITHDPRGTLDVLIHGAHHAAREGDPRAWRRRLVAAASEPSVALLARTDPTPTLRDLGAIAAWRSGVVRVRSAALEAALRVPEPAALAALDLTAADAPAGLGALLDRQRAEPWWWPTVPATRGEARVRRRLGGFRGTGGPWVRLPRVVGSLGDGWRWEVQTAGVDPDGPAQRWLVAADAHGAAIRRTRGTAGLAGTWSGPDGSDTALVLSAGSFELAGARGDLPWDDVVTGSAVCGTVALLSRRSSYAVDVVVADL